MVISPPVFPGPRCPAGFPAQAASLNRGTHPAPYGNRLPTMDYPQAVSYLYSLGNEVATAKLGLENIRCLLNFLGDPQDRFPSVLIAGTNGKGSVAAFCESVLRTQGYRTGIYTSPHLIRIRERMRIGGREILPADLARLTVTVKEAVGAAPGRDSPKRPPPEAGAPPHLLRDGDGHGLSLLRRRGGRDRHPGSRTGGTPGRHQRWSIPSSR